MTDCGLFDEADPLLAELLETTSSPTDELLWAALDGGGGAAEQRPEPGLGLASADAGGGAGLVAAAPAAPGTWRCLDATHAASCEHGCTPAPDGSAAEAAALVGDRGKRNGEKLLRALLLRSPEWHSAGARDAAASDPACGGAHPAAALNRKRATGLRKAELLALLHLWRYKSCIWAPRAGPAAAAAVAARRSRPPRGLQPQQPQQQLLQLPRPVEAPQLHYLAATLGGCVCGGSRPQTRE